MPELFRLSGQIDVDATRAEAALQRATAAARRTQTGLNQTDQSARRVSGSAGTMAHSLDRATGVVGKLGSALSGAQGKLASFGSGLSGMLNITGGNLLSGAITGALSRLTGALTEGWQRGIEYNKMLGTGTVRMERFFQTAGQTTTFVSQLEKFAQISPVFQMPEALTGAQRILEMGFAANRIVPMLEAIGDAVGGTGGSAETIDRITLAFNQMHNAGKITGGDMRQLTEANIPAWELLSKAIGKSVAETKSLAESGGIKADRAIEGMIAMMGEKFAGLSTKAGNTLAGQQSQFESELDMALASGVKTNFEQYKKALALGTSALATDGSQKFAGELNKLTGKIGEGVVGTIKELSSGEAFVKAAQAAVALQPHAAAASSMVTDFTTKGLQSLMPDIRKLGALDGLKKEWDASVKEMQDLWEVLKQKWSASGEETGKAAGEGIKKGVQDSLDMRAPSRVLLVLGTNAGESFLSGFSAAFEQGKNKQNVADIAKALGIDPAKLESMRKIFGEKAASGLLKRGIAFGPGFHTSGNAEIDKLIAENAKRSGVPSARIFAHILRESSFYPKARGAANDRGLGQFLPDTGARFGLKTEKDFFDPAKNIHAIADYLAEIGKVFSSERFATAAYNKGESNKALLKGRIPNPEYVQKVMGIVDVIRQAKAQAITMSPPAATTSPATYSTWENLRGEIARLGASLSTGNLFVAAMALNDAARDLKEFATHPSVDLKVGVARGIAGAATGDVATVLGGLKDSVAALKQMANAPGQKPIAPGQKPIAGSEAVMQITEKLHGLVPEAAQLDQSLFKLSSDTKLAKAALADNAVATNQVATAQKNAASQAGKFADALNQWADLMKKADDEARAQLEAPARFERFKDFKKQLGDDLDSLLDPFVVVSKNWKESFLRIGHDIFGAVQKELFLKATGGKAASPGEAIGHWIAGKLGGIFSGEKKAGSDVERLARGSNQPVVTAIAASGGNIVSAVKESAAQIVGAIQGELVGGLSPSFAGAGGGGGLPELGNQAASVYGAARSGGGFSGALGTAQQGFGLARQIGGLFKPSFNAAVSNIGKAVGGNLASQAANVTGNAVKASGGFFSKLGGLFGLGGGGGGAAGATGFAAAIPYIGLAITAAQIAAPFISKLFQHDYSKDLRNLIKGEYGVDIKEKEFLNSIKQIGESKFGVKDFPAREAETVRLPETREAVYEYSKGHGLKGNSNLFSALELQDPYSAMNIQKRASGGPFMPGWLLIGEKGPELMHADTGGYVFPNHNLRGGGADSSEMAAALAEVRGMMAYLSRTTDNLHAVVRQFKGIGADEFIARAKPSTVTAKVAQSQRERDQASIDVRTYNNKR